MATRSALLTLINNIGTGEANTALELRTILTELANGATLTGDVKLIDCSNAYITANFDGTGLGISERVGWAICNGANGTRNWAGKVPLSYGTGYELMGATGGSKDAVVVAHEHSSSKFNPLNNSGTIYNFDAVGDKEHYGLMSTESAGESGVGKNMQPYTVVLAIMKL